jgi:hypothetical protein
MKKIFSLILTGTLFASSAFATDAPTRKIASSYQCGYVGGVLSPTIIEKDQTIQIDFKADGANPHALYYIANSDLQGPIGLMLVNAALSHAHVCVSASDNLTVRGVFTYSSYSN